MVRSDKRTQLEKLDTAEKLDRRQTIRFGAGWCRYLPFMFQVKASRSFCPSISISRRMGTSASTCAAFSWITAGSWSSKLSETQDTTELVVGHWVLLFFWAILHLLLICLTTYTLRSVLFYSSNNDWSMINRQMLINQLINHFLYFCLGKVI